MRKRSKKRKEGRKEGRKEAKEERKEAKEGRKEGMKEGRIFCKSENIVCMRERLILKGNLNLVLYEI